MNHQTRQFVTGFAIALGLGALAGAIAVVLHRPPAPSQAQTPPAPVARASTPAPARLPLAAPPAVTQQTPAPAAPRQAAAAPAASVARPVAGLEFQQAPKPEASKTPETTKPAAPEAKQVEIKALTAIAESYGLPQDIKLGEAVALGTLSVQAIRRASAEKETKLVTLLDALAAGKVTATETSKDGWVFINNPGDKAVICFPGDLLLGGRKDRVIATCEVIEPGIAQYQVPVFAVETERTIEDTKAKPGQFYMDAAMPQVDLNTRAAAMADNKPARVLKRVAAINKALAGAQEGSIRKGLGATSKEVDAFVKLLAAQLNDDTVGFVVQDATGIVALDWFETKALAAKQLPRLLRGYALSAQAGGYRNARSDAEKDGDSSKRPTTGHEGGTEEATACRLFVRS